MSPFMKMKAAGFDYVGEYSYFDGWIFDRWDTVNGIKGAILRIQKHFVFRPFTLPDSPYSTRTLWKFA